MRVISGSLRGLRLETLSGLDTRPTLDRVKEALFSMLFDKTVDSVGLDLFSGSGALGVELLSRYGKECTFVDVSADAVKVINTNIKKGRLEDRSCVVRKEALEFLNTTAKKFDIIFLDPPYADDLLEKAIAHIARFDILAPHGIMAAEHPVEKTLPALAPPYRVQRTYRYGKIALTLYRRDANETNEE